MHPHVPRRLGFSAAPEASAPGAGRAPGAAPVDETGAADGGGGADGAWEICGSPEAWRWLEMKFWDVFVCVCFFGSF